MWGCFGLGFFTVSQSNFFNHRGGSHREGLQGCGCLLLQGWQQRWQHLCPTGGGCHLEQGKAAGPEVAYGHVPDPLPLHGPPSPDPTPLHGGDHEDPDRQPPPCIF